MAGKSNLRVEETLHELRQPLNVIGLATGNLRAALCPGLNKEQSQYLVAKLDRIDEQVARIASLAEQMASEASSLLSEHPQS